jgi:dihydroorotase
MITIKNALTLTGETKTVTLPSQKNMELDAAGLTILPAVIDPHVHFRTPGMEYKEDWCTASRAAINGGCTTVFDMPNTLPPTVTEALLIEKKAIIDKQLQQIGIPLQYELFFGADKAHLEQIPLVKNQVIGIKVFMGCSTGNLVIDDDESLHAVFAIAAREDMLVAVHAEDEEMMHDRKTKYFEEGNYACHSIIRNIDVAVRAVEKAIALSRQYGTRLYILHVSSAEEIALIKAAKAEGLHVYAETTPHHLFFDTRAYAALQGRCVVNPPLRVMQHRQAIIDAIHQGVIDTIGSDHAPHTADEKSRPYGQCPSGMPGIEFMLPMLLNAHHEGIFTLEEIISLTSKNARKIFRLPESDDKVLVDLQRTATVQSTASKCGWTPYMGLILTGWPRYTILKGHVFPVWENAQALGMTHARINQPDKEN